MPFLTVHDLTHLDALWELASEIAGPSYPLTMAEGFVFGTAVLLHDAAMCLAAYPRGMADIVATDEWKDTVVSISAGSGGEAPSEDEILRPPPEIIAMALPTTLRLLHAKRAEDLSLQQWRGVTGRPEFLIESSDLREFYGRIIGKVARSHGEPIPWIRVELGRVLGPMASVDGGEVNPAKLAYLLRCADAAQLDARRAPLFEMAVVNPKGVSKLHWMFQSKLAKPRIVKDALVYTSGSSFPLEDADAWWLCYESIQTADRELRSADVALEESSQHRFRVRRVRGADSPTELAKDVSLEGWDPVDAKLKVSNVRNLVEMFGGSRLYNDRMAAVRELVQNAADAVRARRSLDTVFCQKNLGRVVVRLCVREGEPWLEVEDNGIGMSERTMTETLLDFGRSFWRSEDVQREFPGLLARGMKPAGRFGIGFFSVFMLGDVVRVTSRRFDRSPADARTLEFRAGLSFRPVLRRIAPGEVLSDAGTRVAVLLKSAPHSRGGLLVRETSFGDSEKLDWASTVAKLCCSLDVNLTVESNGRTRRQISADDWLRISGAKLLGRIHAVPPAKLDRITLKYAKNLRVLRDGHKVYGRACVRPMNYRDPVGIVAVEGLTAMDLDFIEGVLDGSTDVLARNSATVNAPRAVLSKWASEQAEVLHRSGIPLDEKLTAAGIVMGCGGNPGKLPVAHMNGKYLNLSRIRSLLRSSSELVLHDGAVHYDDDVDDCRRSEFSSFQASADVLFLGELLGAGLYDRAWLPNRASYWSVLEAMLNREWQSYETTHEEHVVGNVADVDITRDVTIVTRETKGV